MVILEYVWDGQKDIIFRIAEGERMMETSGKKIT